VFQIKVVAKIKTHLNFSDFFLQNCAVYEIMWTNMVQADRQQMAACA